MDINPMLEEQGLLEQFNLPPKLINFLRNNSKIIWIIIGCVSVVVVAVSLYGSYKTHMINKGASALDEALQATENKEALLNKVVDDFGATPSALWAQVALANYYQTESQIDKAIAILNGLQTDTSLPETVRPMVTLKLAGLYEAEGKNEQALGAYTVLSSMPGYESEAFKSMGRIQESLGNKEQAVAMYNKYVEQQKQNADSVGVNPEQKVVEARIRLLGQ